MENKYIIKLLDAAAYLSMATTTLKTYVKKGLVGHIKTKGGHVRFSIESLEKFKKEMAEKAAIENTVEKNIIEERKRLEERYRNYRERLRSTLVICRDLHINHQLCAKLNKAVYPNKMDDPFIIEILKRHSSGVSAKKIARDLNASCQEVARNLKRAGISPCEELERRRGAKKKKESIRKLRFKAAEVGRESLVEDLYCFYKELGSVKQTMIETGFSNCNTFLLRHPEYKKESEKRKGNRWTSMGSILFKDEAAFQTHIISLIQKALPGAAITEQERSKSFMEIDIMVVHGHRNYLIEVKNTMRKKDMATAFGQSFFNMKSFENGRVYKSIICAPSDIQREDVEIFRDLIALTGVVLCDETDISNYLI